jgi:hypothetical protein
MRPQLALVPLMTALACSFDSTGQINPGTNTVPGSSSSSDSSGAGDTTGPTPTSTVDPTTTPGPTSDPTDTGDPGDTSTTAVGPTSEPMTTTTTTTAMTTGETCGDGVLDPGEACDGADLGGQGCGDFGLLDGVLGCLGDCSIDTSGCLPQLTCGNGTLEGEEVCDGGELGGETCESLMFTGGTLVCADNCTFDTSGCVDVPDDWYDVKYPKRRKLTIPKAGVKGDHVDFPVVVRADDAEVVGDLMPADKLVFASPGKQKLAHEVELTDASRLIVWVKLPALGDAADTEFYVYYGDPGASDESDPAGTWSNGFLGVWHLGEMVMDEKTNGKHTDSTTKGHTGNQHDNEGMDVTNCQIGQCQELGVDDWIELDKDDEFKLGDADATIAAWVYTFNQNTAAHAIFAKSNPGAPELGHLLFGVAAPANSNHLGFEQFGAGSVTGGTAIPSNTWHHVVWTQKKDANVLLERWTLYLDGKLEKEGDVLGLGAVDGHVARLGGPTANSGYPGNFQGRLDAVHISTALRSAEWVETSFNNQRAPAMFTLIGPEETL